ncbi:MAG: QueT transporter family protein [Candidatus Caldarchaeum sp.]|nr:QueT transporter family protein [Candidatus Caldarchaeum sp.]MCX8200613.1 QueT transporter family protein [Candidatus Caldarchaeum sp.]MDW8063636.1 QueT transporter family protein [Candidatus Caldarchaeum sp.]MDW8435756.1 QueT transporter family protein [Candidatus Caldarchaeum sp.]
MKSRDLAAAVVFAGLYAAGVIALPALSFEIIQVRISDALLPMALVFGLPSVIGITIGTFIANLFSPFGIVDLLGGTLTNLVATYLGWKMGRNFVFKGSWLFVAIFQALLVTFVVGSYLYVLIGVPPTEFFGVTVPGIVFAWLGVLGGSVVSIVVVGYPLTKAVAKYLVTESRYV